MMEQHESGRERPHPNAEFLEKLRVQILEDGQSELLKDEQRAHVVFEKISERLLEEPDEGDKFEAISFANPRRPSVLQRQWNSYVEESLASIERRANLCDQNGQARVTRVYRAAGVPRHIDLADWRGRHRARVLYDGTGEPIEIRLTSTSGNEVGYTRASFDPESGGADYQGNSLSDKFERARKSTVILFQDPSVHHNHIAQNSTEALCDRAFPLIAKLLAREREEGRQLVPTSEELFEMSLDQILEHLDKQDQAYVASSDGPAAVSAAPAGLGPNLAETSGLAAGALCSNNVCKSDSRPRGGPMDPALSVDKQQRRRPVVVCGPSGVGKGTLLKKLIGECPEEFGFSVSHTTREPRENEQDGIHYNFCSMADMEAMISRGEFLEYARVHSNLYGTSIAAVKAVGEAGKTCLLDIDVQGAESVKKTDMCARFLFIEPPSMAELEARLRGRGTETEEKIQTRIRNADNEMAYLDKPGFFDFVIRNDDLDVAYARLKEVLLLVPPSAADAE